MHTFNIRIASFVLLILLTAILLTACNNQPEQQPLPLSEKKAEEKIWIAPDIKTLGTTEHDSLIKYGKQLVANTAFYLGPKGTVLKCTNGMNCQNCHLDAGTKPFGNNYSAVASTYPKFRERSGEMEDIYKRVNDCVERSLNGKALDTTSHEMQAIKAYIEWLGKDVPKGTKPKGSGLLELAYLDQRADGEKGKAIYYLKCKTCHGDNGEGQLKADKSTYLYPPLWGPNSYNTGAGLYRISRFAAYVKSNMPFGSDYEHAQLTEDEAWNVAAFVNSQPRPTKQFKKDWPDIAKKPVDHPFGPYADTFSEQQHKYGPFLPIADYKKAHKVQ